MVEGISPKEANERLKRFDEQYEVREQQYKINRKGYLRKERKCSSWRFKSSRYR